MADFVNSSSNNENTGYLRNTIVDIVQIPFLLLIILLALVYIILILTRKTFRSNKLIWPTMNICLATALFSLYQLIFTIIYLENLPILSCRLQGYIVGMSACQLMYAHCASSFNRLLTIQYFNKPLFRTSRWLLVSMGTGWIVSMILALPYMFYDGFACSNDGYGIFLKLYTCFITFLIPINIVSGCNMSILRYLYKISRRVVDINDNNNRHINLISRKRDLHVTKIMLLTFCLFVIGWAPIFFQQLFFTTEGPLQSVLSFLELTLLISLIGNILLLIYANQPVRDYIKEKCNCHGRILCIIKC